MSSSPPQKKQKTCLFHTSKGDCPAPAQSSKPHQEQTKKRKVSDDPSANHDGAGGIKWKDSVPSKILLCELEKGNLSLDEKETSASQAWDFYSSFPEFKGVPYWQFKKFLSIYRQKGKKKTERAFFEEKALSADRKLCGARKPFNRKGEPVFDASKAKKLLREDVQKKVHERMSRAALQASRDEYKAYNSKVFKERIHQEVRYQKYINYLSQKDEFEDKKKKNKKEKDASNKEGNNV